MPSRTKTFGLLPVSLLWGASLGAYLGLRLLLLAAFGLPLLGPGLLALAAVLLAASWALVEEPAWTSSGSLWRLWAAAVLLLGGEALIYHFVEAKERLAPLAFGAFIGAAVLLMPLGRGWARWLALGAAGTLALLSLWAWTFPSAAGMDLVAGPLQGRWGPRLAWALALLGGLCLLALAHRQAPRSGAEAPLSWRREALLLLAVLALGAAIRFPQMGRVPDGIWYDELNLARATESRVLDAGAAPLYVAEQVENPGAYLWVGAAAFKAFGAGLLPYRYLAAIFGLLALVPFWALARLWFGPRWALAATLIFGTMRWTLIPQRIGFMSGFALFWHLAAFWAFWAARSRGGAWRWALAGALAGCNLHTYTPGRLVPVVLGLWLLAEFALERSQRRRLALGLLPLAAGFLATAGPMLWYIATHWKIYSLRAGQVSIFADAAKSGRPLLPELWTSATKHGLMLWLRGDFNARHNLHFYPHVDLLSAAALALALPYALGRFFKDARSRFLGLWILAMLSAGVFTMAVEAPQGHRTILLAPALALAIVWAARDLIAPAGEAFAKGWPKAALAAGVAVLLSVAAFNAYEVFKVWGPHSDTGRSFSPFATAVARRAAASPPDTAVRVSLLPHEYQFHGYESAVFTEFFLRSQGRQGATFKLGSPVAPPNGPPPRALLLIWGESDKDISAAMARQFPDISVEAPPNPYPVAGESSTLYLAAEIPWQRLPLQGEAPKDSLLTRAAP